MGGVGSNSSLCDVYSTLRELEQQGKRAEVFIGPEVKGYVQQYENEIYIFRNCVIRRTHMQKLFTTVLLRKLLTKHDE